MEILRLTLRPRSAFGGAVHGDTLFGQLCWAVRNRWGEERLGDLLDGYTEGRPFAVCSDAFPAGYLPRPALPLYRFESLPGADRKAVKKLRWLPVAALTSPVETWLAQAKDDAAVASSFTGQPGSNHTLATTRPQPHNSIDRRSGTTGAGAFAPYTLAQHWYAQDTRLDVYLVVDPQRIEGDAVVALIRDIGRSGYGRDASIGLGKFDVEDAQGVVPPRPDSASACFTLAPCAPQGLGVDSTRAHYAVFTRFGRHGDRAVFGRGGPFKSPILLAATGALLGPEPLPATPFIGQGLGGHGQVSKTIPETVQQGYAPCLAVRVNWGSA